MASDRSKQETFTSALERAYVKTPCGILPNALWKTRREIPNCRHELVGSPAEPAELTLWDDRRLLLAWTSNGRPSDRVHEILKHVDLALLLGSMFDACDTARFTKRIPRCRLRVDLSSVSRPEIPEGLVLTPVRLPAEAAAVSTFIAQCYEQMRPSPDTIRSWMKHPVFEPTLWIWIRDAESMQPVALGIAEHDQSIGEISLEWIQVHPDARRRGFGSLLVQELLNKARPLGQFATVSGLSGSPAETLYRCCGFRGQDVWWCLQT